MKLLEIPIGGVGLLEELCPGNSFELLETGVILSSLSHLPTPLLSCFSASLLWIKKNGKVPSTFEGKLCFLLYNSVYLYFDMPLL